MKLFVFKAVGSYFGGAIGIIHNSPEEAADLANESTKKCREILNNFDWKTTIDYPECSVIEPVHVLDSGGKQGRFVLAHIYDLTEKYEPFIEFIYKHEG